MIAPLRPRRFSNGASAIFRKEAVFAANQPIGQAKVFGGTASSVSLYSPQPVGVMVQKNSNDKVVGAHCVSRPGARAGEARPADWDSQSDARQQYRA